MKTILFALLISVNLIAAAPCSAVETAIPVRSPQVRQERLQHNGVLVARPVASDQRIAEIVSQNQIRTVQDYAAWLGKNMIYQSDPRDDQWLDPQEFLKTKRGDCEDFAFLNSQVLRVLGFAPHVLMLYSNKNAHAVCAFEYSGKFYWFDNAQLKSSTAQDLVALAQELTEQFHYSRSFELDVLSKQSRLIYQRI